MRFSRYPEVLPQASKQVTGVILFVHNPALPQLQPLQPIQSIKEFHLVNKKRGVRVSSWAHRAAKNMFNFCRHSICIIISINILNIAGKTYELRKSLISKWADQYIGPRPTRVSLLHLTTSASPAHTNPADDDNRRRWIPVIPETAYIRVDNTYKPNDFYELVWNWYSIELV